MGFPRCSEKCQNEGREKWIGMSGNSWKLSVVPTTKRDLETWGRGKNGTSRNREDSGGQPLGVFRKGEWTFRRGEESWGGGGMISGNNGIGGINKKHKGIAMNWMGPAIKPVLQLGNPTKEGRKHAKNRSWKGGIGMVGSSKEKREHWKRRWRVTLHWGGKFTLEKNESTGNVLGGGQQKQKEARVASLG